MNRYRWLSQVVFGATTPKSKPKRMARRKRPTRCPKYLDWIRTLPCAVPACGSVSNIEAAHTGPHGLGQKAPDYQAIPLCANHHRLGSSAIHQIGRTNFEACFDFDIDALIEDLNSEWREERETA